MSVSAGKRPLARITIALSSSLRSSVVAVVVVLDLSVISGPTDRDDRIRVSAFRRRGKALNERTLP